MADLHVLRHRAPRVLLVRSGWRDKDSVKQCVHFFIGHGLIQAAITPPSVFLCCFNRYITRRICLSWLGFFTVHGFLLVAELLSRRAWQLFPASSSQSHFATGSSLESGLRLTGKGAQIFVTVSILLVTGELWFFGPLLEPELVDRVSRSLLWWKAGSH